MGSHLQTKCLVILVAGIYVFSLWFGPGSRRSQIQSIGLGFRDGHPTQSFDFVVLTETVRSMNQKVKLLRLANSFALQRQKILWIVMEWQQDLEERTNTSHVVRHIKERYEAQFSNLTIETHSFDPTKANFFHEAIKTLGKVAAGL